MKQDLIVKATETQQQATHPHQSFWVSASAGTGKTKVLVDRVIRLLLEGALPSQILCLTFTKTAAGEMIERVLGTLKSFIHLGDNELIEKLKSFAITPTAEKQNKARTLFASVLDNIHTLKIQTIHAFCQSVLQKFPIEADLSPSFAMMDDATRQFYIQQAYDRMLKEAFAVNGNQELRRAFEYTAEKMTAFSFEKQKENILGQFQNFSALYHDHSLDKVRALIQEKLSLTEKELSKTENDFFEDMPLNVLRVSQDEKVIKLLPNIESILQKENPSFDAYKDLFLTQKGTVRKIHEKSPELYREAQRTEEWDELFKTQTVFKDTSALLTVAYAFIEDYEKIKKQAGVLDFDDLIMKTARLFDIKTNLPWILYKMDGEINHILVDEAQDTAPVQWKIVDALTAEFFTEGKTKDKLKTLFVVGDKKQSIYRFQGADVKSFQSSYEAFKEKLRGQKYPLTKLPLSISFRTTQDVLDLVDAVFAGEAKGVRETEEVLKHNSARTHTGRIELWPVLEKEETDAGDEEFLRPTTDILSKKTVEMRLADKITDRIKELIESAVVLPSTNKPVQPKDILILLQKRHPLAKPLAKSLKEKNIPFEGLDRFQLKDDLAIQDLLACAKFALFPSDDLNTAALLKSPLFKLSENDIFDLCYDREEKTVYTRISEVQNFSEQKELLDLLKKNRHQSPFDFFSLILENCDGRYTLLQSLGQKHAQSIEELLNLAFDYSKKSDGSLAGFLTYITTINPAIKREFKKDALKGVRLMSVHGSKGLESPIVILPDTTRGSRDKKTIFFNKENIPFSTAYSETRNTFLKELVESEKQERFEEGQRLLYVALTRAKDSLLIYGAGKPSEESWYTAISSGMEKCDSRKEMQGEEEIWVYGTTFAKAGNSIMEKPENKNRTPRPKAHLPTEKEIEWPEPQNEEAKIGTQIHAILEKLTKTNPEDRKRFIEKAVQNLIEKDFWQAALEKVCQPEFDFLFDANVLGEKDIITPSGQILRPDQICFKGEEIWIIDYKTDIPKEIVPVEYEKQLIKYIYSVKT
ncbi:MAG: UvrD-helicase domain-containing protein, partial [Alphaproteobacteria bacterium]|nr:UvrD-helicase domain-containing protein [Alphaproteobacteria bacterium]